MAVATSVTLPAIPSVGLGTQFTPFGGDGKSAPLGVFDVDVRVVGDASGGVASLSLNYDGRYTSMCSYVMIYINADTAAGEFTAQIRDSRTSLPSVRIVGTLPGVAEAFNVTNSAFVWYPPPLYLAGPGQLNVDFLNVDATETYGMACQIYVFNRDVRQITPMNYLNLTRVGVNSVTSS